MVSQTAAAIMAAMNAYIRSLAKALVTVSKSTERIPFLTVSVTASPAKNAPANSKTAATITACFNVKAREPTDVPIALATSLAPMFQAMYAHTTSDRIRTSVITGSMSLPATLEVLHGVVG